MTSLFYYQLAHPLRQYLQLDFEADAAVVLVQQETVEKYK